MAQQITVNVDNPADLIAGYGAGAVLRLERAADEAFTSPAEVSTQALVATTTQYTFWDTAASAGDWYRSRVSDSGGASFSAYSAPFQAGAWDAYATIDSLREILLLPNDERDNLLADILRRCSAALDGELGFDFRRHPAVSGTEQRLYSGTGNRRLPVYRGIQSLTTVEVADQTGGTYVAVPAGEYFLDRDPTLDGYPALWVSISDMYTTVPRFYRGYDTVRLTGVFGYLTVPSDVEQAVLLWAAEVFRAGPGGGGQVGVNTFGTPIFSGGVPLAVTRLVSDYRRRHRTWQVV